MPVPAPVLAATPPVRGPVTIRTDPPRPNPIGTPVRPPDIVVRARNRADDAIEIVGRRPVVVAGLWQFEHGPQITYEAPEDGDQKRIPPTMTPGFMTRHCIADVKVEQAIRRMLGDDPDRSRERGCSLLRIRIAEGRLNGRRQCGGIFGQADRTVRGVLSPPTLDVRGYDVVTSSRTNMTGEMRWRILGRRIAACAG